MSIPVNSSPFRIRFGFWAAVIAVLVVYGWAGYGNNRENFSHSKPDGFYANLSEAFLAGQTYLKVAPHPSLKTLADPYLDAPWLPRLHDATYFHDRYYLYFGPGAALTVLMPWKLLFGTYLSDSAATAIIVAVGFLLGCLLLWKIWSRWFSQLSVGALAAAVVLWGFGNYVFLLIDGATFYSVPIVFAHAVCIAALLAIWQALISAGWRRTLGWFALASFLWAFALAGRPNYLFSLPALAVPFFFLRSRAMIRFGPGLRPTVQLLLAGAVPVAIVGAALALYNWLRYGKLTEFGVHYQFAMGDQRQTKLFELQNFTASLNTYLFSFPDLSPYFPFTSNIELGYSLLRCGPFTVLALLFPLSLTQSRSRFRSDSVWRIFGLTLIAAFALNFVSLLGVPWANERYFGDFTPLAMLLALISGWFLWDVLGRTSTFVRRGAHLAVGALAGWTLLFSALFIVARDPDHAGLAPVTRLAMRAVHRLEQLRHIEHGPLHLQVIFGDAPAGTIEPLVVSGHGRDLLFVKYLEHDRVQFGFFHAGNPAVFGEPVDIKRGQPAQLDLNLGSLYPPANHPLMSGWSEVQTALLTTTVTVELDHHEVLQTHSVFYPTHPGDVLIGSNPKGLLTAVRFSGALTKNAPSVMPTAADLATQRTDGPVRLKLTLPPFTVFRSEPLVSTGSRGNGDVVFVSYIKNGHIRFGHDSFRYGSVESELVEYDSTRPHEIEIDMGSLRASTGDRVVEAPLIVRFDERTLLDEERPFHPSPANQVVFGFNGVGSGIVAEAFAGHILKVETVAPLTRTPLLGAGYGEIRLNLKFPREATGRSEPLLVTGVTGTGDIVYVTYLDETHLKVGVDHWGVGACVSEPIAVDFEQDHAVDVSMGSLFPDDRDTWWGSTPAAERQRRRVNVIVKLDGKTILDQPQLAHASKPEQIVAGKNLIGASTCGPTFRGKIFSTSRLPAP